MQSTRVTARESCTQHRRAFDNVLGSEHLLQGSMLSSLQAILAKHLSLTRLRYTCGECRLKTAVVRRPPATLHRDARGCAVASIGGRTIGVKPMSSVALFRIPWRGHGRNDRSVSAGGTPLPVWTRSIATGLAETIALGLLSGCAAQTKHRRANEPSAATQDGERILLQAIGGAQALPLQRASRLCMTNCSSAERRPGKGMQRRMHKPAERIDP
jgi:hypothetical protein